MSVEISALELFSSWCSKPEKYYEFDDNILFDEKGKYDFLFQKVSEIAKKEKNYQSFIRKYNSICNIVEGFIDYEEQQKDFLLYTRRIWLVSEINEIKKNYKDFKIQNPVLFMFFNYIEFSESIYFRYLQGELTEKEYEKKYLCRNIFLQKLFEEKEYKIFEDSFPFEKFEKYKTDCDSFVKDWLPESNTSAYFIEFFSKNKFKFFFN